MQRPDTGKVDSHGDEPRFWYIFLAVRFRPHGGSGRAANALKPAM